MNSALARRLAGVGAALGLGAGILAAGQAGVHAAAAAHRGSAHTARSIHAAGAAKVVPMRVTVGGAGVKFVPMGGGIGTGPTG